MILSSDCLGAHQPSMLNNVFFQSITQKLYEIYVETCISHVSTGIVQYFSAIMKCFVARAQPGSEVWGHHIQIKL